VRGGVGCSTVLPFVGMPTMSVRPQDQGFRPGMPKLRDMKKSWTLTDFLEMDDQFVFKFAKAKEEEADAARKSNMCLGIQKKKLKMKT
jgi:hypothetical protein